ncbi:hypothetical protein KFL_000090380 [Klebsormidium nitens]|uniref:Uncharacterized protein n=1 Tax=Klebsormidium nitens TaxID=105231 RepID=A0A1Y1HKN9_KLENI|nr:hypothetical protein KFL_000090380 [Klebsormidium nitens]|eukprot:GAQ78192.1 hypothetical protein KFL_000090380 [Klebsormidium nitens]
MAQVLRTVDAAEVSQTMHSHKVGVEHRADVEQPATEMQLGFVESLGSELQHFEEAELESMKAGLAWLSDQINLSLRLKAKVRALPTFPPISGQEKKDETHDTSPDGKQASDGPLTENEKAAVETMFRVEGLVNLLRKQLPKEELLSISNVAQAGVLNGKKGVENQGKADGVVPQTGPGRAAPPAKRKGNKIAERSNSVGNEEVQLARATEVGSACKSEAPPRVELNNAGALDLNETGDPAQQNGAEGSHLPLNGGVGSGDANGEGSGNGDSGQDGQDAADGDVSKGAGQPADDGGDNNSKGGDEDGGGDDSQPSAEDDPSIAEQLADIRSSLAVIGRQHKIAQGILVYLIVSTTIPAFTLIRWKIQSLRILNPLKRFQKDMEKAVLGKTDDSVIDDLLPWKSSETQEVDPIVQQFHVVQEALGGPSEEDAQLTVEADMRAARSHAKKHWWQIGPLRPQEDPELLRTRTERAHLKRLAPIRFLLQLIGHGDQAERA